MTGKETLKMESGVTRRRFLGTAGTVTAAGAATGVHAASVGAGVPARKNITVLGICCSPRKGKTSYAALKICLEEAGRHGVQTELLELAGKQIPGEPAAGVPLAPGQKDDFPEVQAKLSDPKVAGIIIATPVYFGDMSFLCKAFLDRCVVFRKTFALSNKIAGALAVGGGRNGGQELVIRSVHTCLLGQEMIVVGNGQPGGHWGGTLWSGAPGGVTEDEFGVQTAKQLGRRVADVALKVHG